MHEISEVVPSWRSDTVISTVPEVISTGSPDAFLTGPIVECGVSIVDSTLELCADIVGFSESNVA